MTAAPHPELDARFRAEVRTSTRATGIVAGAVGVVALPAWMGFDYIVEPDHASTFALLWLIALGPMLVCLGALFTGFGRRRPELLVLAILAAVDLRDGIPVGLAAALHRRGTRARADAQHRAARGARPAES